MYRKNPNQKQASANYYIRRKTRLDWQCPDCGKGVSQRGRRCNPCARFQRRPESQKSLGINRRLNNQGYIDIKIDGKWIREHRYIWEQTHGTTLPHNHLVHHLDGIKTNNNPPNLYACSIPFHHSSGFIKILQDRIKGLQRELKEAQSANHLL